MGNEKINDAKSLHEFLKNMHPEMFSKPYRPFAIGIDKQIIAMYPGLNMAALKAHLRNITRHPLYLANFIGDDFQYRFNLDGTLSSEIATGVRTFSKNTLRSKLKRHEGMYLKKLGKEEVERLIGVAYG